LLALVAQPNGRSIQEAVRTPLPRNASTVGLTHIAGTMAAWKW